MLVCPWAKAVSIRRNKQKDKLSKAPTKQTQDFPNRDNWPLSPCLGFPGGSAGKDSACNVGDLGLIPGLGRSPGEGHGYLLQYSGLENSTDCIVLGVAKSRTRLSNFTSLSPHWEDRVLSAQESPHLGWSWAFAVTGDQRRPSTWGRAARCCLRRAVIDLDPEMP